MISNYLSFKVKRLWLFNNQNFDCDYNRLKSTAQRKASQISTACLKSILFRISTHTTSYKREQ